MKIKLELNLENFSFWSGAKDNYFTNKELRELEYSIEELYEEVPTETEINDLFWFEEEFLCDCIGINFENEYSKR